MLYTCDPLLELAHALTAPWREGLLDEIAGLQSWCRDQLTQLGRPWPEMGELAQQLTMAYEVLAETAELFLDEEIEAEQLAEVLEAASGCVDYVRESLEDLREVTPLFA